MTARLAMAVAIAGLGSSVAVAGRADLAVERLVVRPLCVGHGTRVELVLGNHGDAIAGQGYDIVLTVQLPGHPPQRLVRHGGAIAPGERRREVFDRIAVSEAAEVLVRAEVDPEHRVDDPDRRDNTAAHLGRADDECDAAAHPSVTGRRTPGGLECDIS